MKHWDGWQWMLVFLGVGLASAEIIDAFRKPADTRSCRGCSCEVEAAKTAGDGGGK